MAELIGVEVNNMSPCGCIMPYSIQKGGWLWGDVVGDKTRKYTWALNGGVFLGVMQRQGRGVGE